MSSPFGELTVRAHQLVAAGDLSGAQELLADALADADPRPANASPELAEAAGLQARVLVTLGEPHSARGWAAFAYAAMTRLYGPSDQRTVACAATLAAVLHRVGSYARAARLYQEVIIELTALDGPESLRVLAAHADLATVEYARGECTVARERLQDAWELHREVYGDGHVSGIKMLARLGAMQRDCGHFAEAHDNLALARELCRQHLAPDDPLAAQVAGLARAAANPEHTCDRVDDTAPPVVPAARVPSTDEGATGWPPEPDQPDPRHPGHPNSSWPTAGHHPDQYGLDAGHHPPGAGYRSNADHPTDPGHHPAYGPDPGYDPDPGYGTEAGYGPDPGYGTEAGYRPDPGYPAEAGYPGGGYGAVPRPRAPGEPVGPSADDPYGTDPGRSRNGTYPDGPMPDAGHRYPADHRSYAHDRRFAGPGRYDDDPTGDDWWPPEANVDRPDQPAGSPPPPAGLTAHPEESPGVRRVAHLPVPRGSRLPVHVPRPPADQPRRLALLIVAGVVVVLLGTGAVIAGVARVDDSAGPPPPGGPGTPASPAATPGGTAAPAGAPPSGVTLRDNRDSVTLTWTYPTDATGPVVVSGGPVGRDARPFQELPAGATNYIVYGLDRGTDYCFTVTVVHSTETIGRAKPVCTKRD